MSNVFSFSSGFQTNRVLLSLTLVFCIALAGKTYAQTSTNDENLIPVPNPASDLWRDVRNRTAANAQDPGLRSVPPNVLIKELWSQVQSGQSGQREMAGRSQVEGVDTGVLINVQGEQWRNFRIRQLAPFVGYLLVGMIILIVLFRIIRGRIPIKAGRSGMKILRFTLSQRTIHWIVAITFLTLGLTGIILLFGRFTILPWLGAAAFGKLAFAAKRIHDFVGPVFGVALIIQFILFVRGNFPSLMADLKWIGKGGGLFAGHASAGRYNAGEKLWFWIAMLGGLVVIASGLVLDFPIFALTRETMVFTHIIHSIAAAVILAVSLGHIYMGTIALEGTFEIMKTGYCDTNWAKEHHDLWYEEMQTEGKVDVHEAADKTEIIDPQGNTGKA